MMNRHDPSADLNVRVCTELDIPSLVSLLKDARLPYLDIDEHIATFYIAEDASGVIVGCVGLEKHNTCGLLRSLLVSKHSRNNGYGVLLFEYAQKKAKLLGVEEMYLLTTDARDYFLSKGFVVDERARVPVEIKNTKQFSSLCPESATVMSKVL
ncbi:arsenic resistance N-acetyltransferase ArsN2 [Pseudomonadota bacterium]